MKLRFHFISIVVLVIGFGSIGGSRRQSYTDVTANPSFINDFNVAEMPTGIAVNDCQQLKMSLPSSPIILKVSAVDSIECFFAGGQQKVCVKQVFAGDGLENGQEIYITSDGWRAYPADKNIDRSFVNILEEDSDYLVFASECTGSTKDGTDVYRLQSEMVIAPVFKYAACENVICPVSEESTYVPYKEVSQNEFFAVEEEGMEAFLELKEEMLRLYP